jgi:hypothetical protein
MATFVFRVRFSWTAQGIADISNAGNRRNSAIVEANKATYGIRVLAANFVLDGADHIEWTVAVDNVDNQPAGEAQINTLFTFFYGLGNVTMPRVIDLMP